MSNYISPQKKQECIDYALAHRETLGHVCACWWSVS